MFDPDTGKMIIGFDIDDGELFGLTAQRNFTLGVEFGIIWTSLLNQAILPKKLSVHGENGERIEKLLQQFSIQYVLEDVPGWFVFNIMDTNK